MYTKAQIKKLEKRIEAISKTFGTQTIHFDDFSIHIFRKLEQWEIRVTFSMSSASRYKTFSSSKQVVNYILSRME